MNTLSTRVVIIFDGKHINEELKHASQIFKRNGYKERDSSNVIERAQNNEKKNHENEGIIKFFSLSLREHLT